MTNEKKKYVSAYNQNCLKPVQVVDKQISLNKTQHKT